MRRRRTIHRLVAAALDLCRTLFTRRPRRALIARVTGLSNPAASRPANAVRAPRTV